MNVKELSKEAKDLIKEAKSITTREGYIKEGIINPVLSTDANGNHTYLRED